MKHQARRPARRRPLLSAAEEATGSRSGEGLEKTMKPPTIGSGPVHFCGAGAFRRKEIRRGERFFRERPGEDTMPKITPCLWFDDQAEDAARFYTSIFKNSKVGRIT